MRVFQLLLLSFLATTNSATAFLPALPFLIENKILESTETFMEKEGAPNPAALSPQWWKYFDVEGSELAPKIQAATQLLRESYQTLTYAEQETALTRVNTILNNLNSLLAAKRQITKETLAEKIYLKAYTLEQQLELTHQIRKLTLEQKNQEDEYHFQKAKISRADKLIDNLMAGYLQKAKGSSEKLLAGLEIMMRRTGLAVLQENLKILRNRIEFTKLQLAQLQDELQTSGALLDMHDFDELQLEAAVQAAQKEYEVAQMNLNSAEANSFELLTDSAIDRSKRYFLDQKVIASSAQQSLAWANLSFLMLKYNLIMDVNERFQDEKHVLRDQLETWYERIKHVSNQIKDWKAASLKEQDRVRQEFALLQNENSDQQLLRLNQSRRQESTATLNVLQLLEEKLIEVQWLLSLLDSDIKNKSNFLERAWVGITSFLYHLWIVAATWGNFSLFKIAGIPITFFMLLKVAFILLTTFYISRFVRSVLMPRAKIRWRLSDSTLYYFSRLIHFCILILGAIAALLSIGMDSGNLFLLAGALFFGIGFGFQTVANNIFCGFRILFERKIKIGDYIELQSGKYGKVTEIQLQHTVILTSDGKEIIVPNSELIDKTLINWTMSNEFRRLHIPFSVATHTDKDLIRKIVPEFAKRVPCTVKDNPSIPDPQVWLVRFGENSLDFELVVWVTMRKKGFSDSREADYLWEIESALREYNIELPVTEQKLMLHYIKRGSESTPMAAAGRLVN